MFSNFASSDERERAMVAFRRLCALRTAREAGYFSERSVEPLGDDWPSEPHLAVHAVSDDEFDEWLAQQPGLGKVIDRLKAAGWWDYESDEGFRGRKV